MQAHPRWAMWLALLVTNAVKVTGIVIAIQDVFSKPDPNAAVLGLAAFMMAGAQISEDTVLRLVSRMFGPPGETPEHKKDGP